MKMVDLLLVLDDGWLVLDGGWSILGHWVPIQAIKQAILAVDGRFLGSGWLFLIVGFVCDYGLNGCGEFAVMGCQRGGKIMWVQVAGVVLKAIGWICVWEGGGPIRGNKNK